MADDKLTKINSESQAMAVPSFMQDDMMDGKKDIDVSSIRLPRLAIAQGLSPEMLPDSSSHIEGLRLFDMFNTLTGDVYGRGPITFIPLQHRVVRLEFDPHDAKILLDRDVPADDPRNEWGPTDPATGKGTPPRATRYTEVVALLMRDGFPPEPIVISIKETNKHQVKAAARITMLIIKSPGPIYGSFKTIATKSETFAKGTAGVFVVNNLRQMREDDIETYKFAKAFWTKMQGKVIDVEREGGIDDFDPDEIERMPPSRTGAVDVESA